MHKQQQYLWHYRSLRMIYCKIEFENVVNCHTVNDALTWLKSVLTTDGQRLQMTSAMRHTRWFDTSSRASADTNTLESPSLRPSTKWWMNQSHINYFSWMMINFDGMTCITCMENVKGIFYWKILNQGAKCELELHVNRILICIDEQLYRKWSQRRRR